MAYTSNPKLPKLRMRAVVMVRQGASTRQAARYFGYNQSTIARWVARANAEGLKGSQNLVTRSSRPRSHPKALPAEIVAAIVEERLKYGRCAEVVQAALSQRGLEASLSSVKRTLARHELLKSRTWHKKKRRNVPRPYVSAPGHLLQVDTIHLMDLHGQRAYVYTLIDLYSRWAYAEATTRISQRHSYQFIVRAQAAADFRFRVLQSDNGPEFGRDLHDRLKERSGVVLRHSRVRQANDNAHIERFNRTIQEECLGRWCSYSEAVTRLPKFMRYYNAERLHMSLNYQTPNKVLMMQSY